MIRRRGSSSARSRARRKAYWPDVTLSLGCINCALLKTCGGMRDLSRRMSCFDDCCGGKPGCDVVCPRNADFGARTREIDGFDFHRLSSATPARPSALPLTMPMIYHGYRRRTPLRVPHAALPLFRVLPRRGELTRAMTATTVREAFRVAPDTRIFLSGVDRDAPLEWLWSLGEPARRDVFARLVDLDIAAVSTPNFSTFTDIPRTDALHALARINRVFDEMQRAGLPAVLHLNGIFERDYERYAEWIIENPGVTHVAVEFGTGGRTEARAALHVEWLIALAGRVGRPLHLVVRGGAHQLPALANAFAGFTVLETTSFSKTINRQAASLASNSRLVWRTMMSEVGAPLDDLLATNVFLQASVLRDAIGGGQQAA